MIKESHKHPDGYMCYTVENPTRLGRFTKVHLLSFVNPITMQRTKVAMAYKDYTGLWYLFNVQTGEEMGSFNKGPVVDYFLSMSIGELDLKTTC